ncbi:MAG: glycosyltransferase family 4 protein [Kocuria sp.]|nr:glycosyltransferase family 4 protein [Kocuria sp.]
MRVAYISADPGIPVFGSKGASVHVQEIIRCWRALGWDVTVYATRIGKQVPEDLTDLDVIHVPVPDAPQGNDADRLARVVAREVAQQEAADLIAQQVISTGADAVYERYSLFSTALAQITETLSIPGFLEVNAPLIDEQQTHRDLSDLGAAHAALNRQVAAATRTACVSEPVADWVRHTVDAAHHHHLDRVLVTPNGVNLQRIRPSQDSQTTGDHAQEPVVVFVGTLKPWHGVEHLIEARSLATRPWRLRLVGDGPQRDALLQQATQLGVAVEFMGAVAPADIPNHLERCAVAVAPYPRMAQNSDQYFSPLKIYEYCAAALPVVASKVGQIPQIIEDGVTGLLVAPSDPLELAQAVDTLVGDPQRRRAMGRAARDMAERERSWHSVLATILEGTSLAQVGDSA